MSKKMMDDMEAMAKKYNPFKSSGGGSSSFQGSGRTLGTKADEEERKKQRLAALEAAQKNKKPSAGTDVDAMRAEILRERERRRAAAQAAAQAATPAAGGYPSPSTANDPARARVAAAAASLVAAADFSSVLTLCKIACNAAEDAFGDNAPSFANPENAFALATEEEREAASTRVDRRSVKFANEKVRGAFGLNDASSSAADVNGNAAVAAFVAAGFVVVRENEENETADALGLTLPYAADVRLVSFLVETMASSHPGVAPLAAKIARLAKPGYRRAKAIDPTKPPLGGRRAQAYTPPAVSAAATMQLDDAFFRRDASEVAEEFARAKARRERESALTTRAWKEREALSRREEDGTASASAKEKFAPVTVRVRLPDGTQLRGVFGPREPVDAVRAFVHESLREPFRKFDLSFLGAPLKGDDEGLSAGGAEKKMPRDSLTGLRTHNVRDASNASKSLRTIGHKGVGYAEEGTVAGAGLAPSALITFSWAEPARPGENTDGDPRVLNDELTRNAEPLE